MLNSLVFVGFGLECIQNGAEVLGSNDVLFCSFHRYQPLQLPFSFPLLRVFSFVQQQQEPRLSFGRKFLRTALVLERIRQKPW